MQVSSSLRKNISQYIFIILLIFVTCLTILNFQNQFNKINNKKYNFVHNFELPVDKSKDLLFEQMHKDGLEIGKRDRYILYLKEKYPDLKIFYDNKSVNVVLNSDNHPGFVIQAAGWMNANKKLYIPDDFSRLGKYGFEELYIDSFSYHSYRKLDKNSNYY